LKSEEILLPQSFWKFPFLLIVLSLITVIIRFYLLRILHKAQPTREEIMMLNPGISLEKATCVSYAKKLAIKFHFMISVCVLVRWHVNLLRQFMRKSRDSCSTLRGTKKEQEPEGATGSLAVQSLFAKSFCHSSKVCTNRTPINPHASPTMTHSTSIFY